MRRVVTLTVAVAALGLAWLAWPHPSPDAADSGHQANSGVPRGISPPADAGRPAPSDAIAPVASSSDALASSEDADVRRTSGLIRRFPGLRGKQWQEALSELGQLGRRSPASLDLMLQGLETSGVLYLALARVGPVAVPRLRSVVREGPERKSIRALKALSEISSPAAATAVINALEDPSLAIRLEAWELLENLKERAAPALPRIRSTLVDPESPNLLGPALRVVQLLGPAAADARPELERLLRGDDVSDTARRNVEFDTWIPRMAIKALVALGPEGWRSIMRFIGDRRRDVRIEIAGQLGGLDGLGPEAAAALRDLIADRDSQVRDRACESAGALGAKASALLLDLERAALGEALPERDTYSAREALRQVASAIRQSPSLSQQHQDADRILQALRSRTKDD